MAELTIDLSTYNDRFQNTSFSLDKQVNFVFGKNGTGKSTIAKAIKEQYSETKKVFLFDGYEKLITENAPLNAIALGSKNAEIQKKINKINKQIEDLEKNIDSNTEGSLADHYSKASLEYNKAYSELEDFYTESASFIKKIERPQIADTSYNKTNIKKEIDNAEKLDESDIIKSKQIINSNNMGILNKIKFPNLKNDYFLIETNKLLVKSINLQVKIEDLDGNPDKQNFARQGLQIHKHIDSGETCAFCGNPISKDRLTLLQKYFSDEVYNLDGEIDGLLSEINDEIENFSKTTSINKDLFYESLREGINLCNNKLDVIMKSYIMYLHKLKSALEEKKKNLFVSSNKIEDVLETYDINKIETEICGIIQIHNKLSNNLSEEQKNSKDKLRYHEIYLIINSSNYKRLLEDETLKKAKKEALKNQVNEVRESIKKLEKEKQVLITETKDEISIAKKINKCLEGSGITSFKLILKEAEGTEEKGQYIIEGYDGTTRPIHELSKGEKNIIAFLYFFFEITELDENNKIVIFDDPMSSNDDKLQYLMTEAIRKLYNNHLKGNDFFILLTHNIHFYLNVRPFYSYLEDKYLEEGEKYHNKKHYYKLQSNGNKSLIVQIKNAKKDFKSNYHELWDELTFLYENNKKQAILNTCRRILETYKNFNGISDLYKGNEEAKKLFDVNSHMIDDFEIDLNGKDRNNIIDLLHEVLIANGGEEHFNTYFILSS